MYLSEHNIIEILLAKLCHEDRKSIPDTVIVALEFLYKHFAKRVFMDNEFAFIVLLLYINPILKKLLEVHDNSASEPALLSVANRRYLILSWENKAYDLYECQPLESMPEIYEGITINLNVLVRLLSESRGNFPNVK